jgi:hypothetical protein
MIDSSVIALASIIVAGIAALANPVVTFLTSRARLEHERKLEREKRQQRRLEATYEPVAEYLVLIRDVADRTEPIISFSGEPGPPDLPAIDELRRRETKIVMYGSPALLSSLATLTKHMNEFMANVGYLRSVRDHATGEEGPKAWQQVRDSRERVRKAVDEALQHINTELRES